MIDDIRRLKVEEADRQLLEVQERLQKIALNQQTLKTPKPVEKNNTQSFDWTRSYECWSDWAKEEEFKELKAKEEKRRDVLLDQQQALGHVHDHSKERDFFQLPEADKFRICEENRLLGNYLFKEGNFRKSAEHYHIAISYYEYCFPDEETDQKALNELRHACLCNMALCFIRIGEYRKAIESATHVLKETENSSAKAFFRRGQAYRMLDEYENAIADLHEASLLANNDVLILKEYELIQRLSLAYKANSSSFAKTALQEATSSKEDIDVDTSQRSAPATIFNLNLPLEPIIFDTMLPNVCIGNVK